MRYKELTLRTKRIILAIFLGIILYALIFIGAWLDDNVFILNLSPFWTFILFGSYFLWVLLFYIISGWRKSEEYLKRVEKWDLPIRQVLVILLLWIVFLGLYYLRPSNKFTLVYACCFSVVILSGAYLRNLYRKELKL